MSFKINYLYSLYSKIKHREVVQIFVSNFFCFYFITHTGCFKRSFDTFDPFDREKLPMWCDLGKSVWTSHSGIFGTGGHVSDICNVGDTLPKLLGQRCYIYTGQQKKLATPVKGHTEKFNQSKLINFCTQVCYNTPYH